MSLSDLLRTEMAWAMGIALVLALMLLALRPGDRPSVRNALLLLGACAFALVAEQLSRAMGEGQAASIAANVAGALVGLVLVRLAMMFLFRVLLPSAGAQVAGIAGDLVTAALYVGWIVIWMRLSGMDPAGVFATSAVITAVVAFSMQSTLGNVLGGVVLQLDNSLRTGDWVRVDDVSGQVMDVTWRHTSVRTRNGETVVIPNGWLLQNRFTVIGTPGALQTPWRRWVRVNIDIEAEPRRVCAVLESAVKDAKIERVADTPAPTAVMMEIGPGYGGYALRYWLTDPQHDDPTDSVVRAHIIAALARNNIALGVPHQQELKVRDDDSHRVLEDSRERDRRVAALAAVDLFRPLTPDERKSVAEHLVFAPFVAGDIMTRQGATAHWLYLIVAGEADVWIDTPQGHKPIATIGAGSVFGEMGMLTGEPRRASVSARTDVTCYRLDKSGFEQIIRARPDVADAISHVLVTRQTELEALRALSAASNTPPSPHADIHAKIRAFFGLD
ncbi:MAG TPA: mechanosensitive ion channel family protein [Usitatibacter sp.]